jgi:hypothetical protein
VGTSSTYNAYYDSTATWRYQNTAAAMRYTQDGVGHYWHNASSGTAGNPITFTQAMTLDASGNLGVGATPAVKFHVKDGTNFNFWVRQNSSMVQLAAATDANAITVPMNFSAQSHTWSVNNGTSVLSLDSSGNLAVISGSLGYGTGVGGTVTQATSRTTGVTLNKICGAITLVSAAGSATYQTFTVTNSTVAATDTIIVNQKSGTDKNIILVTNVAAGSFQITFATTGGTTTEQPVFNFAVIKAVTA